MEISKESSSGFSMLAQAMREGDRRLAYEISLELTAREPMNELAWLYLARNSESLQEAINALTRCLY
jgi:hypothetical protein